MAHPKISAKLRPKEENDSRDEDSDEHSVNPGENVTPGGVVSFCVLENGTMCGRRKLVDTRGFTYNIRKVQGSRTYWWCSVRNKYVYCKASVIQLGEVFRLGSKEHCHEPKQEAKVKMKRKLQTGEAIKVEEDLSDGAISQSLHRVVAQRKKIMKNNVKIRKPVEVKYRIIDEGTRCGKQKLVDSQGYEYNIKCIKNNVTYWWCAVRNKTVHCRAAVSQRGEKFKHGKIDHCHKAAFRPKLKSAVTEAVKSPVAEDVSTSSIVCPDVKPDFEIRGESLSFHILTEMPRSKGAILVDSEGYAYKLKRQKEDQAYWICVEQSKRHRCCATVSQRGYKFRLGKVDHCHKSSSLPDLREAFVGKRKCAAVNVNEVVSECLDFEMLEENNLDEAQEDAGEREDDDCGPVKGKRNRRDIITNYIPAHFLQKDIRVDNEQHLVLAFKEQMDLLSKAQVWYLDTAVRTVSEPYFQLFTITTCVEVSEQIQYVPLVFILMSRCQREDYMKVFQVIEELLPHPLVVGTFVASVDVALWEAVAKVFPDRRLQGCAFQWGKAVWQKVKELELEPDCFEEDGESGIINNLLALPFLPCEHIGLAFRDIWDKIRGHSKFEALLDYIDTTWISNSSWNLSSWSTFMEPVRTRADVESWHIDVPQENEKPSFYKLMWQLLQEGKSMPSQVHIVCDKTLSSNQRSNAGEIQKDIFYLWDMYSAGNVSTMAFLREIGMVCSHVLK